MQTTNDGIYGFTFIAFYELKMQFQLDDALHVFELKSSDVGISLISYTS